MAAARVGNGRRILCGMHGKTAARTAGTSCLTRACLRHAFAPIRPGHTAREGRHMVLIIVVLLIVVILGGLGFALHVLWWVALAALVIWLLGFLLRAGETAGRSRRNRWYRWSGLAAQPPRPFRPAAADRLSTGRALAWPASAHRLKRHPRGLGVKRRCQIEGSFPGTARRLPRRRGCGS